MSTKNGKAATDRTKAQAAERRVKKLTDRERAALVAYNQSRDAARAELGDSVVQWIANVRFDLSHLVDELNRVYREASANGSLLGEVLDPQQLVRVISFLEGAESSSSAIRSISQIRRLDLPDLVGESKNLSRGFLDEQFAFLQANKDLSNAKRDS